MSKLAVVCGVIQMAADPDWSADLLRYGMSRPFLREQSIWALWVYRFGRRGDGRPEGLVKRLLTMWYLSLFRWVETAIGVSLPKSVQIGPGLRIWHFGGIFIHADVVIGSNCTLRHGVTIGNRHEGGAVPVLGNYVELGAYAQVLGGIKIGNGCKIGAMAVVLYDMPDGATAVGAPARIILAIELFARPQRSERNLAFETTRAAFHAGLCEGHHISGNDSSGA